MRKLFKILIFLVVLVAAAAGVYALVRNGGKGNGKSKLVEAQTGSITEKALAIGQIEPRQKFSVKSKISGVVKKCLVQVGDHVQPGDPLFEIAPDPTPTDITDADNAVSSAQAAYEQTKIDLARQQALFKQGVAAKSNLDSAGTANELARITLEKAIQSRELTLRGSVTGGGARLESLIRAPASGTILTRAVNPGDPVVPLTAYQPGTELATIADMSDLLFRGTVDEIDVGKVATGMPVKIRVGALPSDVVTGRVTRIAPQAQQKDGATLFDVWIELDHANKITLRAGYSANAEIVIKEKTGVLTIPERLVTFEDGGKKAFVQVAAKDPKAPPKKTEVTLGISDGLNVEVLTGLSAGQKVVELPPREITSS
jgi:HlyD family secretion protein